jgi:hypothetical protein
MPDARLARARQTLPEGYQFGQERTSLRKQRVFIGGWCPRCDGQVYCYCDVSAPQSVEEPTDDRPWGV